MKKRILSLCLLFLCLLTFADAQSDFKTGKYLYSLKGYRGAFICFQKSAKQGNAEGQLMLGKMYSRGEGVSKDKAKAVEWYKKAAEQGNAKAQEMLKKLSESNKSVITDDKKVFTDVKPDKPTTSQLKNSVERGNSDAQKKLKEMNDDDGSVVKIDKKESSEQSYSKAQNSLVDSATTLSHMIGKNIHSSTIQSWLSKASVSPTISDQYNDHYYYSFKPYGISLCFASTGTLGSIFLYSEARNGYSQYKGELPFGLTFLLNRQKIESILGLPDISGGGGSKISINYYVKYTPKNFLIEYNTKQTDNLNARIYMISILGSIPYSNNNQSDKKIDEEPTNNSIFFDKKQNPNLDLLSILGKNINDLQVNTFLSSLGTLPKPETKEKEGIYYYNFKPKGIRIGFDKKNALESIALYSIYDANNEKSHFRQYQGKLPYNLIFGQTRTDVELVLGKPSTIADLDSYIIVIYKKKNLSLFYDKKYKNNKEPVLSLVTISFANESTTPNNVSKLAQNIKFNEIETKAKAGDPFYQALYGEIFIEQLYGKKKDYTKALK